MSHVSNRVVTNMIDMISNEFGSEEAPLTIQQGKVHDCIGMTLDFTKPDKAKITMIDYIEMMLKDLPEGMNRGAETPAPNHLFDVKKSAEN